MNYSRKVAKQAIRAFMREHYTDARLVELLAHARAGKLSYMSCCCFIGVATADHELEGKNRVPSGHYNRAGSLPGADDAEWGYAHLADTDEVGRRRLIPIILAEMRRRERLRAQAFDVLAVSPVHSSP